MKPGESLSVWLSVEDRRRLEEAATIAGYSRLSQYVRDRALGADEHRGARARAQEWEHRQDVEARLAKLERGQDAVLNALGMLLALTRKRSESDAREISVAWQRAGSAKQALASVAPELVDGLAQFNGDWQAR